MGSGSPRVVGDTPAGKLRITKVASHDASRGTLSLGLQFCLRSGELSGVARAGGWLEPPSILPLLYTVIRRPSTVVSAPPLHHSCAERGNLDPLGMADVLSHSH